MECALSYKQKVGSLDINYDLLAIGNDINSGESEVDLLINKNQEWIDDLSGRIDDLTVKADAWDYAISVCSGVLAGIIDLVIVGELKVSKIDLEKAIDIGKEDVDKFVIKVAKNKGYTGNDLSSAIKYLEKKYKIAADAATNHYGGGSYHHLNDFSHHPTPIGLAFSMLTQFTGFVYGAKSDGSFDCYKLPDGCVLIGKDIYQKITFGVVHWIFHLVSDMDGCYDSVSIGKRGTGLPGPIVSLLKELSALPIFNNSKSGDNKLSVWISKLFYGSLLGEHRDGKIVNAKPFDLRTEIGIYKQIGENIKAVSIQFLPVILNECIVRSFYFLKNLYTELRATGISSYDELEKLNWERIAPYNNATLTRMLTISVGTMEVLDISGAVINGSMEASKAVASSSETGYGAIAVGILAFAKEFALNVNFVGIGRMVICFASEISFEKKRQDLLSERIAAYDNMISLKQSKVWYKCADMWMEAEKAGRMIDEAYQMIFITREKYNKEVDGIQQRLNLIGDRISAAEKMNPGLTDSMLNTLKWNM